MKVNISEIINRSEQGITRPFFCRGDDDWLYYVKGNGAGRKACINEWLAGHLGKYLGLPIPDFKLAKIPKELITYSAREDIADLGVGFGFASQFIENTDELTYLFIEQIDPELRAKILLFDWWIANGDRTLTEHGGNPNILWLHRSQKAFVIDHNLAFDDSSLREIWAHHIFVDARRNWNDNFRREMVVLMAEALKELPSWWKSMPHEWTDVDTGLNLEGVSSLLWRFETNPSKFWEPQ
jgi:hypothetical protein